MCLQLAAFGPLVGSVVMIDVAEQQAALRAMDDQPDVAADTHGPEVFVFGFVELVELHARIGRIKLQVERCRLHGFLLVTGEPRETVGESVGDAVLHVVSGITHEVQFNANRTLTRFG